MTDSTQRLAILFADIAGSTRLYEAYGDADARAAIAECITVLSEVAVRFDGEVIKTIGDEIMTVFPGPLKAALAASEMQLAVRAESAAGRFVTGPLHVKVGVHVGRGQRTADDVLGEASIVAQQVIKLAKTDQILASAELVSALPDELRLGARHIDTVAADGRGGDLEVMELIWEASGVTQVAPSRPVRRDVATRLELVRGLDRWEIGPDDTPFTLGRVAANDAVVVTDLTSRTHAEIVYRGGQFHLADNSSNGTVLIGPDGRPLALRRESQTLRGSGSFCLGGTPDSNPDGLVEYTCI